MTLASVAALALSVLLHVAWNLMARRSEPDGRFLWWALSGWLVLVGPWSLVQLALLLGITCAAEAMYFLALGTSIYSTANKLAVPSLPVTGSCSATSPSPFSPPGSRSPGRTTSAGPASGAEARASRPCSSSAWA